MIGVFKRPKTSAEEWIPSVPNVQEYIDTEGRKRLHAPYLLPNDERDLDRLSYQHYVLRQVLHSNTFAPVDYILSMVQACVLDVGAGNNNWGIELAMGHPQVQVVGLDIKPVSPKAAPLNYECVQGNILQGSLPFRDNTFHYTHQRLLISAIPVHKWPDVIRELKRVTTPSGWIELVEGSNNFAHVGPNLREFLKWGTALAQARGIDPTMAEHLPELLARSNLQNIRAKQIRIAIGEWGGRVGKLLAHNAIEAFKSFKSPCVEMGISPMYFDSVISALEVEFNQYKTMYSFYFTAGQVL